MLSAYRAAFLPTARQPSVPEHRPGNITQSPLCLLRRHGRGHTASQDAATAGPLIPTVQVQPQPRPSLTQFPITTHFPLQSAMTVFASFNFLHFHPAKLTVFCNKFELSRAALPRREAGHWMRQQPRPHRNTVLHTHQSNSANT